MIADTTSRPAISAWTAISPFGLDRASFVEGVRNRRSPATPVNPERWSGVPYPTACTVPDFEPRKFLGTKGTRAMNRVSGLSVAATKHLLADIGVAAEDKRDDIGFVLGTTTGSMQSMMDLTRASMTADKPDHVEPAAVPGCVMNCAAGQAAIWHGLRGPNATIAGGRTTGPHVLNYGRRLLLTGRASQVLCGAAEEFSVARSWVEHSRRARAGQLLGEGCAMFLLEPADRVPADRHVLATLEGFESRVCVDGDLASTVVAAVRTLLAKAGIGSDRVWAATCSDFVDDNGVEVETAAIAGLFGDEIVNRVPAPGLIGDTASASALFQLAAVLSVADQTERDGGDHGADHAVVTSCDEDGSVACTLLRLGPVR